MTYPLTQNYLSNLSLPLFLQNALIKSGYEKLDDFEFCTVEELSSELKIGRDVAEDILRQVETLKAGPSRSFRPSSLARPSQSQRPFIPPPASQTVASLIQATSTALPAIDELLGGVPQGPATPRKTPHAVRPGHPHPLDRVLPGIMSSPGPRILSHLQTPTKQMAPPSQYTTPGRQDKGKQKAGIYPGMVLEVASPPGGGKTSFVRNVAVRARLESVQAEVLIIDAEGSLTAQSLRQCAEAMTRFSPVSPSSIVEGIHLLRATTQVEFLACLHTLDEWLYEHPHVRLVIIDTLSFHFRGPNVDTLLRKRVMELVKQKIARASTTGGCAVIICNQMATKLLTAENKPANFETGDKAVLMPGLGDAWITPKTLRMALFKEGRGFGDRFAHVQGPQDQHSGSRPWASFDIDLDGVLCDTVDV